jgi:predicted deacylase
MTTVLDHLRSLEPGTRARGQIVAGRLASGQDIAIPYLVMRGGSPGPCLWVNGNVHGDEINGMVAGVRFEAKLDPAELQGALVVVPTANPLAFNARERHTPHDGQDLDRTFPGRNDGLVSDRLAAALFEEMKACADMLVSLHSIGWVMSAKPYAVYKLPPASAVTESTLLRCIAGFEPMFVCRMGVEPGRGELPGHLAGAVDYQFLCLGRPAIMVELGSARTLQMEYVEQTVTGLHRLCRLLEMLPGEVSPAGWPLRRVTQRRQVTCTHAGIFHPLAVPGERVRAGRVIGEIHDLWGDVVERITFEDEVLVIGIRREPVVHTGDRAVFVATQWDDVTSGP